MKGKIVCIFICMMCLGPCPSIVLRDDTDRGVACGKCDKYDTSKKIYEVYDNSDAEGGPESGDGFDIGDYPDESSFEEIDNVLEEKTDISFMDIYELISAGEVDEAIEMALSMLSDRLIYELKESRALAVSIISVICLGSLLTHMASGTSAFVSSHSFMVIYLVLATLLLTELVVVVDIVSETIEEITRLMEAFYPLYASMVMYVSGAKSAAYSSTTILLANYICQNIIGRLLLPFVKCSGILYIINNLNKEDYFSKLAELARSVAVWGLRIIFVSITGVNIVKTMITPSLDRITRSGALRIVGRLPGMGGISSVVGVMLSTGEFMKNCMGAACTIVIIVMAILPMAKIMIIMLTLKCIAALIQPVGDPRFAKGVTAVANTVELCMKVCSVCVLMFVISIAIMTLGISPGY